MLPQDDLFVLWKFFIVILLMLLSSPAELNELPRRIISLVPSQTELLYDLGLEQQVAGITRFCVKPRHLQKEKAKVGGTKSPDLDKIQKLEPDLIIANREENLKDQILFLAEKYPVWVTDVHDLPTALDMIEDLGGLTGAADKGLQIADRIREGFHSLSERLSSFRRRKAAYLIWQDPYMTVGGDSFISAMMEQSGLDNVFREKLRYPETTLDEIRSLGCEILLLPSEPFRFTEKHRLRMEEMLPGIAVVPADGEMFSWYGSRMLESPDYFHRFRSENEVLFH